MGDISPPKPRRKVRKTPVTDREKCLDVVTRDGVFTVPRDAMGTGLTYWLNSHSVDVYNRAGDYMMAKASLQSVIIGADADEVVPLTRVLTYINKELRFLRKLGHNLRKYVLEFEECQGINEPLNWSRD